MNGFGFVAPSGPARSSVNLASNSNIANQAASSVLSPSSFSTAPRPMRGGAAANAAAFGTNMRQAFMGKGAALPRVESLRCQAKMNDVDEGPALNNDAQTHHLDSKKSDNQKALAKGLNVLKSANAASEKDDAQALIKPFKLTSAGKTARQVIKRGMYAQLALGHSAQILAGKSQPLIEFHVEHSPPSLFINYRIKPEKLDAFRKAFNIPDDVKMMPMQCIKDGEAGYLLSVNIYAVSGITTGLRSEESIYIDRGDGKPSYLILGATTDNFSMDPVDVVTLAGDLKYDHEDDKISISYTKGESEAYQFKCNYSPDSGKNKEADPLAPWIAANDFIYWPNGVCDRAFYNGNLIDEPVDIIESKDVKTKNTLPWAEFVDPEPVEVFALKKPLDFVISPWHNVDK